MLRIEVSNFILKTPDFFFKNWRNLRNKPPAFLYTPDHYC